MVGVRGRRRRVIVVKAESEDDLGEKSRQGVIPGVLLGDVVSAME